MVMSGSFSMAWSMDQQLVNRSNAPPLSNPANLTVFFDKNEAYLFRLLRFMTHAVVVLSSSHPDSPPSKFACVEIH